MKKEEGMSPEMVEQLDKDFTDRDTRNYREIGEEENNNFKEAFGEDHPDYKKDNIENFFDDDDWDEKRNESLKETLISENKKLNIVKITHSDLEKENIMYDELTKEEYWESKKRDYPKPKLSKIGITPKRSGKYIVNQLLGLTTAGILQKAIELKAIVKKRLNGIDYYCIPTEEVLVGMDNEGKPLKYPKKIQKVTEVYTQFRKDLASGKFKKL